MHQQQHHHVGSNVASQRPSVDNSPKTSPQAAPDPRTKILCRFFTRPSGCQNGSCPYLHATEGDLAKDSITTTTEDDEDREDKDYFVRKYSGAFVSIDAGGRVLEVSLSTDFSMACIIGMNAGTTPDTVVNMLYNLGYDIGLDSISICKHPASSETRVLVKAENPQFAQELSNRLQAKGTHLRAVPLPIDPRGPASRKLHVSWHNATRTVGIDFGDDTTANRVAQKFNDDTYKILGQSVRCTTEYRGWGFTNETLTLRAVLHHVPEDATVRDIEAAIQTPLNQPPHVEMGYASYQKSTYEVSREVRSLLEEYGPLETFYLFPTSSGKQAKAAAVFHDEADARSACWLNDQRLVSLDNGMLTVTLIQSAKVKVQATVCRALISQIDEKRKTWEEQQVVLRVYPSTSHPFTTLKLESDNMKALARARMTLEEILSGIVLKKDGDVMWSALLDNNGPLCDKIQGIEKDLDVVISRDKSTRRLRFYGPVDKLRQTEARVAKVLEESLLSPITSSILDENTMSGSCCPICLCEAENPIQTSCKHVYCLSCFEKYCTSVASTNNSQFQVHCQGDEGSCSAIFTLPYLKKWLCPSVFEVILQSSFDNYIRRHPETFRYCPTPDCGDIYRCNLDLNPQRSTYTCLNCFESTCIACHAQHEEYTCDEFKHLKSGDHKTLKMVKEELNVKDCLNCTTPLEKRAGCDHVVCPGCKMHICWICMAFFEISPVCYAHIGERHGGPLEDPNAGLDFDA